MRIRTLEIQSFRGIGRVHLALGPGINVVFGSNDLGKSTVAEALRAVFLVPSGAAEARSYVSWITPIAPRVTIVFDVDERTYRVTKIFGTGRGSGATLEEATTRDRFAKIVDGRAVDERIRQLLGWGLPTLGGRGRPRSDSFLTIALLAQQGDVSGILSASLEGDAIDSGRLLITKALDAMAQDPVVARLIERLDARLDEAFTKTGRYRHGGSSPLVAIKERLIERQSILDDLERQREESERVATALSVLHERRDRVATEVEALRRELEGLRRNEATKIRRSQLVAEVDRAQEELNRAANLERDIANLKREIEELDPRLQSAQAHAAAAAQNVADREAVFVAARDTHEKASREVDRAKAISGESRAKRQTELMAVIDASGRALDAANEAEAAELRAGELKRELDAVRCAIGDLESALEEANGRAALATALALLNDAQKRKDESDSARIEFETLERAAEVARADAERFDAERDEAQRLFDSAKASYDRLESGVKSPQLDLQEARTQLLQIEREKERAAGWLERAATVRAREDALTQMERELSEKAEALQHIENDIEERAQRLELLQSSMEAAEAENLRRDAAQKRTRADAVQREWDERERLQSAWRAKRQEAQNLLQQHEGRTSVAATDLPKFHRLEDDLQKSRAESPAPQTHSWVLFAMLAGVGGLVLGLAVASAMRLGSPIGPWALSASLGVATFAITSIVARRIGLRNARAALEARRAALEQRWADEVAPLMVQSGQQKVADLEAYRSATESLLDQARRVRREADDLQMDLDASRLQATDVQLAQREAEEAERLAQVASSAARAGSSDSELVPLDELRRRRSQIELSRRSLVETRQEMQAAKDRIERQFKLEREELSRLRSQLDGDPVGDRETWQARRDSIEAERQSIERIIQQIEARHHDDDEQIRSAFRMRKSEFDAALSRAREAHEKWGQARENAAERRVRWESARRLAEDADRVASVERVASLRQQWPEPTGHVDVKPGDPAEIALALNEKRQAARALEALAKQSADAARLLAERLPGGPAAARARATQERDRALQDRDALKNAQDTAIEQLELSAREAKRIFDEAQLSVDEARRVQTDGEEARLSVATEVERTNAKLEALLMARSGMDTVTPQAALARASEELAALPDAEFDVSEIEALGTRYTAKEQELKSAEIALHETQGKLQLLGGTVIAEQCNDEREAIERLHTQAQALEEDLEAHKVLVHMLRQKEEARSSHLGSVLAQPITDRFLELAGNKYQRVLFDSHLRAEAISALGEYRDLATLSVGTRDQLATLLRLAIGTQLKTTVLLDDQLVHSDAERLRWFREEMRSSAQAGTQIIVLTCRPEDYFDNTDASVNGGQGTTPDSLLNLVDFAEALADGRTLGRDQTA